MSRSTAFKFSANMALAGEYSPPDLEQIRNSLKLLKSKRAQRPPTDIINSYDYAINKISALKSQQCPNLRTNWNSAGVSLSNSRRYQCNKTNTDIQSTQHN
jgi:hypothetical protein